MLPVEDFIAQYRGAAEELWLAGLVRAGYTRLDWSQTFDGPALSRQEKLSAIDQLIDAGCPLFPESISVLAPVIIELCDFSGPLDLDQNYGLDTPTMHPVFKEHLVKSQDLGRPPIPSGTLAKSKAVKKILPLEPGQEKSEVTDRPIKITTSSRNASNQNLLAGAKMLEMA